MQSPNDSRTTPHEDLPFLVELWRDDTGDSVERVLARAASVQLAQAIFRAAREEQPARRITLREGDRIVADTVQASE